MARQARDALNGKLDNGTCASLFPGHVQDARSVVSAIFSPSELTQYVNGVRIVTKIEDRATGVAQVSETRVNGQLTTVTLSISRAVWDSTMGVPGQADDMYWILIHEIGHIVDTIFGNDASEIISPDGPGVFGPNSDAVYWNNYIVDQKCFNGSRGAKPVPKPK